MNHFILNNTYQTLKYSAEGKPVNSSRIQRDRLYYGKYLLHQLDSAWEKDAQQRAMFAAIKDRQGTYIEFQGAENYSLVTKSLENTKQGIRLLNVREVIQPNSVKTQSATVFIPAGKENYFNQRIQAYLDKEKNKDLVDSIETIKLAVISSFWTGEIEDIPDDFYTKMTVCEADEWMENLKERLSLGSGAAHICILDTGVNCEHPLLENVLSREYIVGASVYYNECNSR